MIRYPIRASSAAARVASNTKSVHFFPLAFAARSIRSHSTGLMRRFRGSRSIATLILFAAGMMLSSYVSADIKHTIYVTQMSLR